MNNEEHTLVPSDGNGEMARGGGTPPQQPDPLKKVLSLMRGRWWWAIGLAVVLGTAGGVTGWFVPEPVYESSGIIRIEPSLPRVLYKTEQSDVMPMFESYVNTQVSQISSQRVLWKAMEHSAWQDLGRTASQENLGELEEGLRVDHPKNSQLITVAYQDPDPQVAQAVVQAVIDSYQQLYGGRGTENLTERLDTLEQRRSRLRSELQNLRDRRRAVAQEYGTDELGKLYSARIDEAQRLRRRLRDLRLAMMSEGVEVEKLPAPAAKEVAAQDGQQPAQEDRQQPGQEPADGQAQGGDQAGGASEASQGEDAASGSGDTERPAPEDLTVQMIAQNDGTMRQYLQQRQQMERQLERLKLTLGPNHREVTQARSMLSNINQTIEEYAADYREQYANRMGRSGEAMTVEQMRSRYQTLLSLYEDARAEAKELGNTQLEIESIRDEEQTVEAKLEQTNRRIEELNIESSVGGRINVVSTGSTPLTPARDQRKLGAAAGGMFGVGLGGGLVLLVGFFDRRLRYMHDARDTLDQITMLGILPRLPEDLADPAQAASTAHCVHQIRTLLQIGADAHDRRVFSVTSPADEAGKTSLTLALGVSFAASGSRTLMVDCNADEDGLTPRVDAIIRRKIGQVLQRQGLLSADQVERALAEAQRTGNRIGQTMIELGYLSEHDLEQALTLQEQQPVGVLDALSGEPVEQCVAETGIENLSILPIGAATSHDVYRMSPSALRRVLEEARSRYDVIIVDSGEVPASVEASHIAAEVDSVVMVVSRGDQSHQAENSIDHLFSIGARVAGVVFNRASPADLRRLPGAGGPNGDQTVLSAESDERASRFGPVARAVASTASNPNRSDDDSES